MIIKRRLFSAVVKWGSGISCLRERSTLSTKHLKRKILHRHLFNFREFFFRMYAHFLSPFSNAHVRRIRGCWVRNAQLHLDDYRRGRVPAYIQIASYSIRARTCRDPRELLAEQILFFVSAPHRKDSLLTLSKIRIAIKRSR